MTLPAPLSNFCAPVKAPSLCVWSATGEDGMHTLAAMKVRPSAQVFCSCHVCERF